MGDGNSTVSFTHFETAAVSSDGVLDILVGKTAASSGEKRTQANSIAAVGEELGQKSGVSCQNSARMLPPVESGCSDNFGGNAGDVESVSEDTVTAALKVGDQSSFGPSGAPPSHKKAYSSKDNDVESISINDKTKDTIGGPPQAGNSALDHLDALGERGDGGSISSFPNDNNSIINGTNSVVVITRTPSSVSMKPLDSDQQNAARACPPLQPMLDPSNPNAAACKSNEENDEGTIQSSSSTLGPNNQRLLMEALMLTGSRDRAESWGGMSDLSFAGVGNALSETAAAIAVSALHHTGLIEDVTAAAASIDGPSPSISCAASALGDHDCFEDGIDIASQPSSGAGPGLDDFESQHQRQSQEHETSYNPAGHHHQSIPTKIHLHDTKPQTHFAIHHNNRPRKESIASLSSASVSMGMGAHISSTTEDCNTCSSSDIGLVATAGGDQIQGAIAAAMATVQEQLEDIAGTVENAAAITLTEMSDAGSCDTTLREEDVTSASKKTNAKKRKESIASSGNSKSADITSTQLTVDYDAVAAAVSAATAVSGNLDLSTIGTMEIPGFDALSTSYTLSPEEPSGWGAKLETNPPATPTSKSDQPGSAIASQFSSPSSLLPEHQAAIGYEPPSVTRGVSSSQTKRGSKKRLAKAAGINDGNRKDFDETPIKSNVCGAIYPDIAQSYPKCLVLTPPPRPPIKKRKRPLTTPQNVSPQATNIDDIENDQNRPMPPLEGNLFVGTSQSFPTASLSSMKPSLSSSSALSAKNKPKSSKALTTAQKWDEMFECLLEFIEEKRKEETGGMKTKEEKVQWVWDGNVPTNYKSKDGKGLGRWINNQRSAKSKGTLKEDREIRLVSTGLKWSVLSTNPWENMMEELKIYIHEQTKDGKEWDGNVPTNYKIKGNVNPDSSEVDEDKNLGRWINRQRCLYQSGKLKKDRQKKLEAIGLKWSVLSTSSWEAMFDALSAFAKSKRDADPNGVWDGNVPVNFKTDETPPKSLGRWVNRQRSAYSKNDLSQEYIAKLESVGLKWSVFDRRGVGSTQKSKHGGTKKRRTQENKSDGAKKCVELGVQKGTIDGPSLEQDSLPPAEQRQNSGSVEV